jgi:pimeloyl-ACP methyl ester carboxylesterase
MTGPRSTYVSASGFELHVTEWGDPGNPALVMWHGLARTGAISTRRPRLVRQLFRDLPRHAGARPVELGEGSGDRLFLSRSSAGLAEAMLDHYGIDQTRWVGTSMGGLIGVTLAAGVLKDRITHLVINDIGPTFRRPAWGASSPMSAIRRSATR